MPAVDNFTEPEPVRLVGHAFGGVDELGFQLAHRPLQLLVRNRLVLQPGYFAVDEALQLRQVGAGSPVTPI